MYYIKNRLILGHATDVIRSAIYLKHNSGLWEACHMTLDCGRSVQVTCMSHDWIVGGVYRSHACHMTLDCGRSVQVTCMPHDWIVRGVYKRGGGHQCM